MTELNIFYRYFVFAYFLPCLFSRFLGLNVTIAMKHFSSGGGLHAANSSQPTYQSSQQTTGRVTRSIKKRNVASPPPSTLMWLPILNLGTMKTTLYLKPTAQMAARHTQQGNLHMPSYSIYVPAN